jgi:hypothetical protein
MSSTRNGKIARLPYWVRRQLNRRLQDGEVGKKLVGWLNGLPEVKKILKTQFGGRPVSGQNLSEWKQGGHQDWLRYQETRGFVEDLRDRAEELKIDAENDFTEMGITEHLAVVLAAELARVTDALMKETDNPQKRWRRLREVLHELGQFRRHNHRATRLQRDKILWQREYSKRAQDDEFREWQRQQNKNGPPFLMQLFRSTGHLGQQETVKSSPDESNPFKPDQTNFSNGHPPTGNNHDPTT